MRTLRSRKKRADKKAKPYAFKKPYTAENTTCKSCSIGVLKPTQWNMLVCSKCTYSELV